MNWTSLGPVSAFARRLAPFGIMVIALTALPRANAQSTWNNASGGSWNDAASWTPNAVPNGAGAAAIFSNAASGSVNITLAADVVAGSIVFDSVQTSGAYNIGT